MAYSELGRDEDTRAHAEELLKLRRKCSVESFAKSRPYKNPADAERLLDALRKARLK